MTIERFTKAEFEYALPTSKLDGAKLWVPEGLEHNEETYAIPVREGVKIFIRSSVRADGLAHETGKDSIRCWLVRTDGSPMGNKIQSHISRVRGWQDRMINVIRELWKRAQASGDCPNCGKPLSIFKVKKDGKNKGRLFCKCWDCKNHETFRWLDEDVPADHGKCRYEKIEAADEATVRASLGQLKTKKDKVRLIRDFIEADDSGCLWALGRVFDEQTADEQRSEATTYHNKVGFSGVDAKILSSFAKQFENRGSLSPKQMALAKKKLPKYSKQILTLMEV